MATFNLNGLGTPKSATYDNESAYRELLSRVNNGESNSTVNEDTVRANEVEPNEEGQDFTTDLFKLLIDEGFTPQIAPLFRTVYGYVNAVFNFPNGRMYFRLEHTDELMDYLADKKLL